MIDPNNVLLRCPNGHELQAARSDLDKDLACPVCNMTFRPQAPSASAIPPPPPGFGVPSDRLGYAAGSDVAYMGRAKHPAYTIWLLGLWLFIVCFATITGAINLASPNAFGNSKSTSGVMPITLIIGGISCVWFICIPIACIFQLVWNHRVHADARRFAMYDDVSPGLALGLSFIPVFNIPWTAFTMVRLANFAAKGERQSNSDAISAVHAAKLSLITGIVMAVTCCTTYGLMLASVYPVINESMQNKLDPKSPEVQAKIQDAANVYPMLTFSSMLIVMAGTVVFAYAVRRLETSLYDRLGALPK